MTKNEVADIMKRVKNNYQEFSIDEDKTSEWVGVLKDYLFDDVNNKLTEYLEDSYNQSKIPKVYALVKGLLTQDEKNELANGRYLTYCKICNKYIKEAEYEAHFDRCSSIKYILKQYDKYNIPNKPNAEDLYKMKQEEFDIRYDKLLKWILEHTEVENEKNALINYFEKQGYGADYYFEN